jgi:hypothetical protein
MSSEPLILTPREADALVAEKVCKWARIDEEMPRYITSVDRCIEAAERLNGAQEREYLIYMHNYACEGLDIVGTAKLHRNLLNAPALIRVAAMLSAVLGREVRIET